MNEKHKDNTSSLAQFGAIVKSVRKAKRLTREEFGKATGLTIKTVLNIEQGRGCRMDSFLNILSFMSLDDELYSWFKEKTDDLCAKLWKKVPMPKS